MRTTLKVAVGGAVAVMCWFLFVYANAIVQRRRAEMLLRDLQQFSSAQEFTPTFLSLRQRYGKSLKRLDGCAPAYCAWEIRVSNRPLPFLYRIPYTELSALFQTTDDTLYFVLIDYKTAHVSGTSPIVHVQMDACEQGCQRSFYVHPHGESPELWNGIVQLNAKASNKERQAALSFNFDCFTAIRGCDDIAQMLPSVWKHIDSRRLVSRLPSLADASWDKPQE